MQELALLWGAAISSYTYGVKAPYFTAQTPLAALRRSRVRGLQTEGRITTQLDPVIAFCCYTPG